MVNNKKKVNNHNLRLRAKLRIDEGFAENPLHSIRAFTSEKDKGHLMIDLIENYFSISEEERKVAFRKKMDEFNKDAMTPTVFPKELQKHQIKFTRDEKGNIVSPFRSKRKVFDPESS